MPILKSQAENERKAEKGSSVVKNRPPVKKKKVERRSGKIKSERKEMEKVLGI